MPLHFSFYLTLVLSSPLSFLLPQTLWQIWQELSSLPSCTTRLQWVPGYSFLLGTMQLMSWPDRECYLHPLQPLVVSLLLTLVSTLFFSWSGGILSHQNSLTHTYPRFPPRNLCSLVVFTHLSRLCCNGHSILLGSYLSRIGRIENPSCSTCGHSSQGTSHLILQCPAMNSLSHSLFGNSLSL